MAIFSAECGDKEHQVDKVKVSLHIAVHCGYKRHPVSECYHRETGVMLKN